MNLLQEKSLSSNDILKLVDSISDSNTENIIENKTLPGKLVIITNHNNKKIRIFYPKNTKITNINISINSIHSIIENNDLITDDLSIIKKYKRKSWIKDAIDIFPEMRNLTKEENEKYQKSLSKLFTPTGRTLFD